MSANNKALCVCVCQTAAGVGSQPCGIPGRFVHHSSAGVAGSTTEAVAEAAAAETRSTEMGGRPLKPRARQASRGHSSRAGQQELTV